MIPRLSIAEQTAAHLRENLSAGRWREGLPGVRQLAGEFGVSHDSVRTALRQLEAEGRVAPQGQGRRRQALEAQPRIQPAQRIGVLLNDRPSHLHVDMQRDLFQIRHGIEVSGNVCVFTRKTQTELRDDPTRIARLVQETRASAWLLVSASLAVVKWFEAQSFPVLAWGGRVAGTSISSCAVDIAPALRQAIREFGRLGHKRIVMIGPAMWRRPCLGTGFVRAFLDELSALGVRWSEYNLPDWEETPEGLKNLLESLFRVTPPQALIVDHASRLPAVLAQLARRGLRVPKDVSLACIHQDASLSWCDPPIAHMCYDDTLPIRYILKWVQMAVTGKVERKHFNFPAEFDPAGSIGLVPA